MSKGIKDRKVKYTLADFKRDLVKKFGEDILEPAALFEEGSYFTHIATGDENSKWGKTIMPCHADIVESTKIKEGYFLKVLVKTSMKTSKDSSVKKEIIGLCEKCGWLTEREGHRPTCDFYLTPPKSSTKEKIKEIEIDYSPQLRQEGFSTISLAEKINEIIERLNEK